MKPTPPKQKDFKVKERGCEFCPLDKAEGVNKVKGLERLTGKRIMVWAQNPGEQENAKGQELIGPAGQFFWKEAARFGLRRADCDIQNVVRCWTVDRNELHQIQVREPSKKEIHCCSLYTEQALAQTSGKTLVHLILGKVAAKTLLRGEYRKDKRTLYSKKLKAWCISTYHPSYFLRGAPRSKLREFHEALESACQKAKQAPGRFAFLREQDYRSVPVAKLDDELVTPIQAAAALGERIAVDIEDSDRCDGENVIVYVGFSWQPGLSRGVFLDHALLKRSDVDWQQKVAVLKSILEDPEIKKAFQHGNYDVEKLKKLLGITVRGYDHDTEYSEYIRFSSAKRYGLAAIADTRFREFAGYKDILDEYRHPDSHRVNFWILPPKVIVRYNGADCHLTKLIEKDNHDKVDYELLQVLIKAAHPLARMEELGPIFDTQHDEILQQWIPQKLEKLTKEVRQVAGDKELNLNSPLQLSIVIYDKLNLGRHLDIKWLKEHQRSTDKETMLLLGRRHKLPLMIIEYRALAKKQSTYMTAYRKSAELHNGRLRTKWWLTGTVTCRLRSGGEKDGSKGIVNLQNIHGAKEIECLLISDKRWRFMYQDWQKEKMHGGN